MEEVALVHVDVDGVVLLQGLVVDVVLYGRDVVVHEQLRPVNVPGEAAYAVVHGDYVGIEAADEVVQGIKRRNFAAGRHVHVHAEGGEALSGWYSG